MHMHFLTYQVLSAFDSSEDLASFPVNSHPWRSKTNKKTGHPIWRKTTWIESTI